MPDTEYHVASFVVSVRPQHADTLAEFINAIDGLEVHAAAGSKLVVTAEATSARALAELADQVRGSHHALAVSPVYHEYTDSEEPGLGPDSPLNSNAGASD